MSSYRFGKFVWFEIRTRTPAESRAFYTELFPWGTQDMPIPDGTYTMFSAGERTIGGIGGIEGEAPPHWLGWISVEDVDATLERINAGGGKTLVGPIDMPEMMRMAWCADPEGAVFAIMKATDGDQPDIDSYAGIFHWVELYANDGAAAAKFYGEVFGYEVQEQDMAMMGGTGRYWVLSKDGKPRAGIMTKPQPEIPSMWLPYVHVEDLGATVSQAVEGGAKQLMGVVSVPGIGRFTTLSDPEGAAVAVVEPE